MSELPFYITSTEARRRHANTSVTTSTTAAAATNNEQIPTTPSSNSHSKSGSGKTAKAPPTNAAYSLGSNLWSAAQTSFQSFAEQISNDFASEQERDPSPSLLNFENTLALPIEMPFRDRTNEFKTVAKSCQLRHQPNGHLSTTKADRDKILQSSIYFNQLAKRIGRDLSMTCAKMEKLSQLAKNKSLFDDRAGEIEELSQMIKQEITGLNKQIANLQVVATKPGAEGIPVKQEQQCKNHSKLVVVGLQSKLASVSKTFKNVLEIRTENLKLKRARREKFSKSAAIPSNLPPSASTGNMGSILLNDDLAASSGTSSFALDMDRLEQHRLQDQVSLIDETDTYHQSRYNAMETIESSISELGTIFRQLASLVSEQGEMITRIDSNIEETAINVEAAHHELLRYFNSISRNRWLIVKVFGVLMAFFIFFVIFMT